MFLQIGDQDVMDFDLDILLKLLEVIDSQIASLETEINESDDPDGFGLIERWDGIAGLGFVACQQYLNATWRHLAAKGEGRSAVIASPPMHACGQSFATLIDKAANFWKHNGEWDPADTSKKHPEASTRAVVELLVSRKDDYPMASMLDRLPAPGPPRFASLVLRIVDWRNRRIELKRSSS